MKIQLVFPCFIIWMIVADACEGDRAHISGELRKWHAVMITFDGPETNENATPNPFTDFRLMVTFTHQDEKITVPGYYAADGNAAESSAGSGNKWRVKFAPNKEGYWTYVASFRSGKSIAVSDEPKAGDPVYFDGDHGSFFIKPTDKTGADLRGKGKLQYVGDRYLRFAETGEFFLKGGADSPENFLAYADFDGTHYEGKNDERMGEALPNASLHEYRNHIADWQEGDPDWRGGKGKGIIGALNYLSSKGMNSVYFLTLNIGGDGEDVWPYTEYQERQRFDCSKLDQWDIIFSRMDRCGIMLHVVTQETENELLLDNGDTGDQRKLYYRELIARFGYHLAITWNMGEENGYADFTPKAQSHQQQQAMVQYIKTHDPYKNFVVIHTHSDPKYRYCILGDLLGFSYLDGPSIQIGNPLDAHHETLTWLGKSQKAGKPWVVNIDEIGPASRGVDPDDRKDKNNQDSVRSYVLWANLMAGGGGVEWYFGYRNHDNDLGCEDWRSRERMWDRTRIALDFFHRYLPFWKMESRDQLTPDSTDYCFAQDGELYTIYLPQVRSPAINLSGVEGTFDIRWYDPRNGGELKSGSVREIDGGHEESLGLPPSDIGADWVVLLRRK
jgi:Domain of unknown function (DUF5060)/Putative collagen-binding domain of a collagenase